MSRTFVLPALSLCLLLWSADIAPDNPAACKELLNRSLSETEKIKTIKFRLKMSERCGGKLYFNEMKIKLNRSPYKIYLNLGGKEVLWVQGQNNGLALVNPNGFPFINLNLNPMGSLMRENQHHTLFQLGYDYFAGIIRHSLSATGNAFEKYFSCAGTIIWNGTVCYVISAEYPDFAYTEYTVQKGETLVSIAGKLNVNDYMLLEINPKVKGYTDAKEGQKIKVPNVYAKKMTLYIDKELLLPRMIRIYDDKGLYESYEYCDLEVNPKIADEEFTKNYKEYGF